jgi:hypothetical protein
MAKNEYRNKPYQVEFNRLGEKHAAPIKSTIILDDQMEANEFDEILYKMFAYQAICSAFGGPNEIEIQ